MTGIYFSGTGNSRHAVEVFLHEYDRTAKDYPIEDVAVVEYIKTAEELVFAYSVQYSNLPKMVADFVDDNQHLWQGKKVFIQRRRRGDAGTETAEVWSADNRRASP